MIFIHRTDSVIALMDDHIRQTRDEMDHQIFHTLMIGRGTVKQFSQEHKIKIADIRVRRNQMMANLRSYLNTVGVDSVSDIEA